MKQLLAPILGGADYTYPVWNRLMEVCGIAVYFAYTLFWFLDLGVTWNRMALDNPSGALWSGLAAMPVAAAAILIADFVSGFVHCAADNFGKPTTPFFGVAFIKPFRDHHTDPQGITRHGFIETNGNSCIVNLIVLIPAFHLVAGRAAVVPVLTSIFVLMFTLAIMMTNQIHKWAHMESPPQTVVKLQRMGILLSPKGHKVHHTIPFDKNYCITTGWMNPVTEKTSFFAWLVRTFKR